MGGGARRPCAAFGSFVYVFAAPFEACVPQCAPLLEFCMKLIVWPKAAGKGIVAGTDFTCC